MNTLPRPLALILGLVLFLGLYGCSLSGGGDSDDDTGLDEDIDTGVLSALKTPYLFFDYGRRRSSLDAGDPGYYTASLGRTLVLAPVRVSSGANAITDAAVYEWKVDGLVQPEYTGEFFPFTPAESKRYTITVSARDGDSFAQALTYVDCLAPEGAYRRQQTPASQVQARRLEFTPAPGQFIRIPEDATEEEEAASPHTSLGSLGAWGGYSVWTFDHSVKNEGGYNIAILGNAFTNWSEPGVVWVSQDENGNGKPDDSWYELKASETGKPDVKQRYAVTYFKGENRWADNLGNSGASSGNYPNSIKGDYVGFAGTRLPSRLNTDNTAWGYVDCLGPQRYRISDAIQADGSPVNLKYVDFVKVQCGIMLDAGIFGEVSTEITDFFDYNMKPGTPVSGGGNGPYSYTFTNNSGYELTVSLSGYGDFVLSPGGNKTITLDMRNTYFDASGGNITASLTSGNVVFNDA